MSSRSDFAELVTIDELHRRAYTLVEQKQSEARDAAIEHLNVRLFRHITVVPQSSRSPL